MKSCTKRFSPSSEAYTSQTALSSVLDPKIKSARVPTKSTLPVLRFFPSNSVSSFEVALHVFDKFKTFVKKSLVKFPIFSCGW